MGLERLKLTNGQEGNAKKPVSELLSGLNSHMLLILR